MLLILVLCGEVARCEVEVCLFDVGIQIDEVSPGRPLWRYGVWIFANVAKIHGITAIYRALVSVKNERSHIALDLGALVFERVCLFITVLTVSI